MFPSLLSIVTTDLSVRGIVYVKFCDIRDADRAFSFVQQNLFDWTAQHVSSSTFASKNYPGNAGQHQASINEGQVSITAKYLGSPPQPEAEKIACDLVQALGKLGQVMALRSIARENRNILFRIEFYDLNAAHNTLLHPHKLEMAVRTALTSLNVQNLANFHSHTRLGLSATEARALATSILR